MQPDIVMNVEQDPIPAPVDPRARVVVLGKDGCHLCEVAHDVVAEVCARLGVAWEEHDMLADPRLAERYHDEIPVIFVDGVLHGIWRVNAGRLARALGG